MSRLKARIFDIVMRAAPDGIASDDLHSIVREHGIHGDMPRVALKVHINQLNGLIADSGWRIESRFNGLGHHRKADYVLVKSARAQH